MNTNHNSHSKFGPSLVSTFVFAALLGGAGQAQAQMGMPGGMSPGGMNPPPASQRKEEGPAEAAPEEEGQSAGDVTTESVTNQRRRRTQVIELDGYFRVRPELLHNFNLGLGYLNDQSTDSSPPFPTPLECGVKAGGCSQKNLGQTSMRLRLEPTINISDQVRVISQIDILDNVIFGSNPDSMLSVSQPDLRTNMAQAGILSSSQVAPENGQNTFTSSVRPKRAWAEVDSQLGSLRFGRMPWHFGRGMYFNRGDCQNCDGGTTVDRLMVLTQLWGHQFALSWDFGHSGYAWGLTDVGRADPNGPPLDLSQNDEVVQFTGSLSLQDDDRRFRERAQSGEVTINYGTQLVYRQQNSEIFKLSTTAQGGLTPSGALTREDLSDTNDPSLTHTGAWLLIPSIWFKLGWKALTLEFESTALAGRMGNAGPLRLQESPTAPNPLKILQLGWVLAADLRLYKDSLFVGLETGGASGDQAETACQTLANGGGGVTTGISCNPAQANIAPYLNHRWKFVPQPLGDSALHNFYFSPEYHVDEIFFRRIMGTVNNAMYFKPSVSYWLDVAESRQLGASAALIYSLAPVPVSTPGNSISYGLELDLSLGYRNIGENFYAGMVWGVFWPFGALNRPSEIFPGARGAGNASAAQILRGFLGVRF